MRFVECCCSGSLFRRVLCAEVVGVTSVEGFLVHID